MKKGMGPDQKLVCVKQERADEWEESMPLPGDIMEGFADNESDDSFVPVKAKSEFNFHLGKVNPQNESIWLKVRRGYSTLKLQARIVQQRSSILQKKYTIQAATDNRHIAELDDVALEQCTELQEMSKNAMDLENRGFRRSGIKYDWKVKTGMHLPDSECSVVSSILFMPLEGKHCVSSTTGRCMTWFCAAVSSGVPPVFVNIQTEQIAHLGFMCIYSVIEGSAAEKGGVREVFEEATARGFLLVISRLRGKSVMPSIVCSEGLIHCCDQYHIKDILSSALDGNDPTEMHVMAWPTHTRLSPLHALLPPPGVSPSQPFSD